MTPELRDQLAEARNRHAFEWHQQPGPVTRWLARCCCRAWEERVGEESQATAIHRNWQLHAADDAVSVVAAYVEQQARTRAANELQVAADRISRGPETWPAARYLQARAAALRGQA